jgi:hypothetical protein
MTTFFCSGCFKHRPVSGQRAQPNGKRTLCATCVTALDTNLNRARRAARPRNAAADAHQRARTTRQLFTHLHFIGEL